MKKHIIPTILFSLVIIFGATAQTNDKDLKGPAYKNRKPWKDPKPATTILVKEDGKTKKGAGVKALMPFERKTGDIKETQFIAKKNTLKGPAYKNKKVWQEDTTTSQDEDLIAEQR